MQLLKPFVSWECRSLLAKVAIALFVAVTQTHGAAGSLVTIINGDFEATAASTTSFGALTPANNSGGWVSVAPAGYIGYPPTFQQSGTFAGYLNAGGSLTNVLASTWAAGTYTLNGFASPETGTGRVVNYSLSSGIGIEGAGSTSLVGGGLAYVPLTPLVVTVSPFDAAIGTPITLAITNSSAGAATQLYVDTFTLDFEPHAVPEPSTLAMFALGIFAVTAVVSSRRRYSNR